MAKLGRTQVMVVQEMSSRRVLILAATLAALANAVAAFVAPVVPTVLEEAAILPAPSFVLMIAHQGVRLGRSVHVVHMADHDYRATYTALSNSVVGLILLARGVFGVIAKWLGIGAVLAIFTFMAASALFAAGGGRRAGRLAIFRNARDLPTAYCVDPAVPSTRTSPLHG